jgi:hypothetical protein
MRDLRDSAESDDMGTSCSRYCARKQEPMQTVVAALLGGPGNPDEAPGPYCASMIAMISLHHGEHYYPQPGRKHET